MEWHVLVGSFWRRLRTLAHGIHLLATKYLPYGMAANLIPLSDNPNWDPRPMGNICVHRSGTKFPTEFIPAWMV